MFMYGAGARRVSGRLGGTLSSRIEVTNGKSQASIVILQEDQPCHEEQLDARCASRPDCVVVQLASPPASSAAAIAAAVDCTGTTPPHGFQPLDTLFQPQNWRNSASQSHAAPPSRNLSAHFGHETRARRVSSASSLA
eukprot:scaffold58950_cov63-Phaeocystis_antarctica.AAC.10